VTDAVGIGTAVPKRLVWDQRLSGHRPGVVPGCTEPMAPSVKSYSELQRELISVELGRRAAADRKAAQAAWHSTRDDLATAPSLLQVLRSGH